MLPRVLIVDESADSRDVLRTLLERHGATTIEAHRPEQALELADQFRPHLIVMDAESDHSPSGMATNDLCTAAHLMDTPVVILGILRQDRAGGRPSATSQFVAKPYHYGPLIRKIEALLAAA
jgi:DNA-binding response OmpR family regulator